MHIDWQDHHLKNKNSCIKNEKINWIKNPKLIEIYYKTKAEENLVASTLKNIIHEKKDSK